MSSLSDLNYAASFDPALTALAIPVARCRHPVQNLSHEDQALFRQFGWGPVVAPSHDRIHAAFEQQAKERPLAPAVEHLGHSISYAELDRLAGLLARQLRTLGVRPGDNVALFLRRSIPMVVGMLAVLKAGAAYVPQDVGLAPVPQLRHIMATAATRVVLTLAACRHLVPEADGQVCLAVDEFMAAVPADGMAGSEPSWSLKAGPDAPCFVLFTSGTTGMPNGVRVTHRNVCNILLTEPGSLGMRPGLKVGQLLNIAFDMAAWEILGCLAHGATLILRGSSFQDVAEQVDVVIATPSILAGLDAGRCRNVKVVAVAGEPCPRPLADTWAAFCNFYNACGPTETTIVNTAQHYTPGSPRLTIGKPTPNNTVYVLDEYHRPKPIGEAGEMWAGGDCVTAGYVSNPALTAERYRPDPFLGGGRMMFRTRDLGRWTLDGELEHLGRVDDQVKVRGFRVELDSVSLALERTPACAQAATLKLDERNLVGFVCPASVDTALARQVVGNALPYYCVPSLVIAMEALPITGRGKVDRRALMLIAAERAAATGLADPARQPS